MSPHHPRQTIPATLTWRLPCNTQLMETFHNKVSGHPHELRVTNLDGTPSKLPGKITSALKKLCEKGEQTPNHPPPSLRPRPSALLSRAQGPSRPPSSATSRASALASSSTRSTPSSTSWAALRSESWSSGASHPAPHPPALRTSAPRAPSPDAQLHYGPRASATLASTTLPTSSASPATTSSAADPLPHPPLPQLQVSPRREPRGVGLCQGRRRDAWPRPCRQRTRAPRWLRPGGGGFLREPLRHRVRSGLLAALALARPRLFLVL